MSARVVTGIPGMDPPAVESNTARRARRGASSPRASTKEPPHAGDLPACGVPAVGVGVGATFTGGARDGGTAVVLDPRRPGEPGRLSARDLVQPADEAQIVQQHAGVLGGVVGVVPEGRAAVLGAAKQRGEGDALRSRNDAIDVLHLDAHDCG